MGFCMFMRNKKIESDTKKWVSKSVRCRPRLHRVKNVSSLNLCRFLFDGVVGGLHPTRNTLLLRNRSSSFTNDHYVTLRDRVGG